MLCYSIQCIKEFDDNDPPKLPIIIVVAMNSYAVDHFIRVL